MGVPEVWDPGRVLMPGDLGIGELFERIGEAAVVADGSGRIRLWNPAAERLFGYSAAEAVGELTDMLVPEDLRERHRDGWRRFHSSGSGALVDSGKAYALPALRKSGERVWVELSLSSIRPRAGGETAAEGDSGGEYVLALVRDVSARREAEEAVRSRLESLRRLHEAALAVAAPVPPEPAAKGRLLGTIVSSAVAALDGMAGRLVVADDGAWRDVSPGSQERDGHVAVRQSGGVGREPLRLDGDVRHVLETGEPVYIEDVARGSRFGDFPAARARGVGSFAVVPLRAGGRVLGALTVDFARTGALATDEREMLEVFAGHAAAALERVALLDLERRHAGERAARAAAEGEVERFAFLAEVSATLASSLDYQTTLRSVARLAVPRMADWCIVYLAGEAGGIERVAMAYADERWEAVAERINREFRMNPSARGGVPHVLRTGEAVLRRRVTEDDLVGDVEEPETLLALVAPLGISSWMCAPLEVGERTLGAISFMVAGGKLYDRADLGLAEAIARRAALAVENARLYAAEQAAREAAEAATRARDEFLSVAAHELKTPLTSLRGMVQLSLRRLERQGVLEADRLERALRLMDEQTGRLARLTDQLLDVSRLERGRVALDLAPADVVGLARRVAEAHPARASHAIRVLAPADHLEATVDGLRLEQVLANLLDNAARHAPAGSEITLEVAEVAERVGEAKGGAVPERNGRGTVLLAVRDHGPGVPPEHRERIFDRFYQVNAGAATGGLGLGLAICREVASLHGGAVWVEEPPGGGARFVVQVPR